MLLKCRCRYLVRPGSMVAPRNDLSRHLEYAIVHDVSCWKANSKKAKFRQVNFRTVNDDMIDRLWPAVAGGNPYLVLEQSLAIGCSVC